MSNKLSFYAKKEVLWVHLGSKFEILCDESLFNYPLGYVGLMARKYNNPFLEFLLRAMTK